MHSVKINLIKKNILLVLACSFLLGFSTLTYNQNVAQGEISFNKQQLIEGNSIDFSALIINTESIDLKSFTNKFYIDLNSDGYDEGSDLYSIIYACIILNYMM